MATEHQINRIKYLRGNGLSQKEISEDVGLSPQMVSVILKNIASKFGESKPIKLIHAIGFVPKDTVVEFSPRDFENHRESDTLYSAEQSVYETKQGIVHKTTFPDSVPIRYYPQIADLLHINDLPEKLFSKDSLRSEFFDRLNRLRVYESNKLMVFIGNTLLPSLGINRQDHDRSQFTELIIELSILLTEKLDEQLQKMQKGFIDDMPDIGDEINNIRFHLENMFDWELVVSPHRNHFTNLEKNYLSEMSNEYPFLAKLILSHDRGDYSISGIEKDFQDLTNEVLAKKQMSIDDLQYVFKFGTMDKELIDRYISTGASTISQLDEIEEKGVSNMDELKAARIAFNNQAINIEDYPSISESGERLASKIRSSIERDELDDVLVHSFTHFETHAKKLWRNKSFNLSKLGLGWSGDNEHTNKIFNSILLHHKHVSYVMRSESYTPTDEELNQIGNFTERSGVNRGNRANTPAYYWRRALKSEKEKELFCWNYIRSKISKAIRDQSDPSSEILVNILCPILSDDGDLHAFCEESRHIRNDLLHDGETKTEIITRHVRSVLEMTELIIAKHGELKSLMN